MFQKVLVPLDCSKRAEAILSYISWFAKALNIPVAVLSVVNPDARDRGPNAPGAGPAPT